MTLNPTEIKLCIQKNNHNLNPATVTSFDRLKLYEVMSAATKEANRRLHSKFIVFRSSDKDLILIGSPNFTSPALLKTSKDGNFESAMLFEINSDNFIKNYLNIDSITENEVKDSKRVVIQPTNSQTMPEEVPFPLNRLLEAFAGVSTADRLQTIAVLLVVVIWILSFSFYFIS